MINVPNNIKIDLRKKIAEGELNDRIQGMTLERKYDPISNIIPWILSVSSPSAICFLKSILMLFGTFIILYYLHR